ncbi:MAG: hypothetical protein MI749_05755 [Desulfovibrionales bacterium]|nr:hypothetical protein [Desulfovibrionales bacterium]
MVPAVADMRPVIIAPAVVPRRQVLENLGDSRNSAMIFAIETTAYREMGRQPKWRMARAKRCADLGYGAPWRHSLYLAFQDLEVP